MPKRGRRRKKTRTHVSLDDQEKTLAAQSALSDSAKSGSSAAKIPKSLVLRRGKTVPAVVDLVDDLRQLMLPYTAVNFREDARNRKLTLTQYAQHLALPMGITHILAFSQSNPSENGSNLNLRLARTPEGPTLTFRVHRFSLNRDIRRLQKRPIALNSPSLHTNPPIVVTNNFNLDTNATDSAQQQPHVKLMRITFQNMFPAINVSTVKLRDCRRVVLFHFQEDDTGEESNTDENKNEGDQDDSSSNSDKGTTKAASKHRQFVHIRHFAITATPVGVNRRVRRLVQSNRKLPNLHKCQDISDYLNSALDTGVMSDSEAEEDDDNVVQLSDKYVGRGNSKSQKSAVKLVELGPRLCLELIKVEKGLGGGDVLYHAHVSKTPEEAAELKARKRREMELKEQRRAQQEANVERKRQASEEKRQAKRQRQQEREEETMQALRQGMVASGDEADSSDEESD